MVPLSACAWVFGGLDDSRGGMVALHASGSANAPGGGGGGSGFKPGLDPWRVEEGGGASGGLGGTEEEGEGGVEKLGCGCDGLGVVPREGEEEALGCVLDGVGVVPVRRKWSPTPCQNFMWPVWTENQKLMWFEWMPPTDWRISAPSGPGWRGFNTCGKAF